jgi:hypothetical protein
MNRQTSPTKSPGDCERFMVKSVYTADATVTGGRTHGHARTSDGVHIEVELTANRQAVT